MLQAPASSSVLATEQLTTATPQAGLLEKTASDHVPCTSTLDSAISTHGIPIVRKPTTRMPHCDTLGLQRQPAEQESTALQTAHSICKGTDGSIDDLAAMVKPDLAIRQQSGNGPKRSAASTCQHLPPTFPSSHCSTQAATLHAQLCSPSLEPVLKLPRFSAPVYDASRPSTMQQSDMAYAPTSMGKAVAVTPLLQAEARKSYTSSDHLTELSHGRCSQQGLSGQATGRPCTPPRLYLDGAISTHPLVLRNGSKYGEDDSTEQNAQHASLKQHVNASNDPLLTNGLLDDMAVERGACLVHMPILMGTSQPITGPEATCTMVDQVCPVPCQLQSRAAANGLS
jgi:hypothetical protein